MSSVDLVILGMLLEKPQSAYELQKDVVNHHYDKWSKIGIPTIYQNVHRLQVKCSLAKNELTGLFTVLQKLAKFILPNLCRKLSIEGWLFFLILILL